MPRKNQDNVLGLAPLPPQQESSTLTLFDPFAGVYHTLTKDQQRIVDEWRKQGLEIRARQLLAVWAGRTIGELSEEVTEEFALTAMAIDPITDLAQGTPSAKHVAEFNHRQKQILARHLEDVVNIAADNIKAGVGRSFIVPTDSEERRDFFQRLYYLVKGRFPNG